MAESSPARLQAGKQLVVAKIKLWRGAVKARHLEIVELGGGRQQAKGDERIRELGGDFFSLYLSIDMINTLDLTDYGQMIYRI